MEGRHQRCGEPRKRPHCLMIFKITSALFRECWTRSYELQRDQHVSFGVASCQSEILSLKKAAWRLWLVSKSRTKSSAEGCEPLLRRAASVARPPSSPSHARTALSRTICGRIDLRSISSRRRRISERRSSDVMNSPKKEAPAGGACPARAFSWQSRSNSAPSLCGGGRRC
jgi:hypothetical protein